MHVSIAQALEGLKSAVVCYSGRAELAEGWRQAFGAELERSEQRIHTMAGPLRLTYYTARKVVSIENQSTGDLAIVRADPDGYRGLLLGAGLRGLAAWLGPPR